MNLEFRADGVTLIGVLIANGKAQAVTDTSWANWPSRDAPSWPAWSAAWPPPVCTRRSSSWWVITEPECSKRPSRVGGPFLLLR